MLVEHERNYGSGMLGYGCSGYRIGVESRSGRSLQEGASAPKVHRAKLGHGQLHCPAAGRATT